jgi:uncharacterized protein
MTGIYKAFLFTSRLRLITTSVFAFFALTCLAGTDRPNFKKETIQLGSRIIVVEIAKTPDEMAYGLMFRKNLNRDQGMLFVYSDEQPRSFWMKNTFVPLSIGFFNKNRELIDIQEMSPVKSEIQQFIPTYQSKLPAQYALEMPSGWFKKNKLQANKKIKFEFIKNQKRPDHSPDQ